jgi:serine/threonine-protein kinase
MSAASHSDPRVLPQGSNGSVSSALPGDVVGATARRLMVFMYVVAASDALYTALYLTVWRAYGNWLSRGIAMAQIVGSLLLARYLRRCPRAQSIVTRIGIAYEIAICFSLALLEICNAPPSSYPENRISWGCVVIVLFPMLVPARPRTMVAASFAAAATTPIAYAVSFAIIGHGAQPAVVLASLFMPQFVCAGISVFLAMVMHRLGTEVGRARQLGSYELVDKLGAGGMGEVWRARHRLLVRPAAIKLIQPQALGAGDLPSARELRDRFEREAQATSLLTSPHTVELYDFGVSHDGVFYYVMELLDGVDLETLVRDHGPVPPERAVWLLRQACDSLDDAHRAGLVHRDIKPANIVASRRGRHCDYVKVLDFGLVKGILTGTPEVQLTGDARIKGTPAYLPPEAAKGAAIDARSDLYALGCVAYWLVTGALLFDATTPLGMAVAHITGTPKPASMRSLAPIPPEFDRLILQCLAKDPAARPASALELQRLLDAIPFADPWSEERAAAWWREHPPSAAGRPIPTDPARPAPRTPTLLHPAERSIA